jgi:hypothetical protein
VVTAQSFLSRRQLMASLALEHRFVAAMRKQVYAAIARAQWSYQHSLQQSDVAHVLIHELDRAGVATSQLLLTAASSVLALVYVLIALRVSPLMTMMVTGAGAMVLVALSGRVRSGTRRSGVRRNTAALRNRVGAPGRDAARQEPRLRTTPDRIGGANRRSDRRRAANAVRLHAGSRTTPKSAGSFRWRCCSTPAFRGSAWMRAA